jgi:hypothetical protein
MMSPDYRLTPRQEGYLRDSIERVAADRDAGAVYTLLGAYWRARREGLLLP